ncbi:unnamed protein product [Rotaria sp. Silwood1]|nr:unnamed protein product [Rotaria sp. Silwood1]
MTLSKFDSLPPELIVEISDYLDGCDLYYAFYGISLRINTILNQQCHRLHVSFIRISKIKFDLYCNLILPRMSAHIVSLKLCGDNSSTPGQLTLFLTRFNALASVFIKLESFKLIDYTKSDVEILVPHFSMLSQLKCLSIGEYKRLMPFTIHTNELFNENVILPISLRSLAFPYEVSNEWIQTSSITTSFVEQLHVHHIHINALHSFLQSFSYLKRLTAVITGFNQNNLPVKNNFQSNVILHKLQYLNVNITQQLLFDDFAWILRNLTELQSLSLEALNPDIGFLEAHRWETVLPTKLSSFRFDLTMALPTNPDHLQLLEPFKSQYWVSRCWFVQCRLRDGGRFFRLSTIKSPIVTILNWPDDEVLLDSPSTTVYSNVTHIELWWNLSKSAQAICPNVRSIQFYGAVNDQNETVHPNIVDILQNSSLKHIIINDNLPINHISQYWVSRCWFVQCRLRDRGRFFRLSTIKSPIVTILNWPDDEVLLDSPSTTVYSNVTHIELWWNLSKSAQAICPNVRSIQFYGAVNDQNEAVHPNIVDILQNSSLKHIIINDNLPINHIRFATILCKSSNNIQMLTCSANWLLFMLEYKQYEWICLLTTMRIRKLVVNSDEHVLSNTNLIAFCRTFINLQEITMKMETTEDMFFLLNTLENLTMANIELPNIVLGNITDNMRLIKDNTILVDFVIRKQVTSLDTCKLILWIGPRHNSDLARTRKRTTSPITNESKYIIFEHVQVEKRFKIYQNASYESLLKSVKTAYGLPADEAIVLFHPDTNDYIVPSTVQDLLINTDSSIPKYQLITRDESGADKDGWFKWFKASYFVKFLRK